MMEQLSTIHNYNLTTIGNCRIFGPPKDFDGNEPGDDCEIVIYNIPIDETEDMLLATLLKFKELYHFKRMLQDNGEHREIAFAKFTSASEAKRAIQMLKYNAIYLHNNLYAKSCDTFTTTLYIGNINITRHSLHKVEQILLRLCHGLESFVVHSLNKFNRYIISLSFFTVQDFVLSLHDIYKSDFFIKSPEILVTTIEPTARLSESMPVCKYTYKMSTDCKNEWPAEIYTLHKEYNELRMF